MATQRSGSRDSKLFGGLLLVLGPLVAWAEGITEQDVLGDIPVVSAVSWFEQRLEQAPASVTIIDRKLIEMSGAQNVVDIFRLVPGFQAYQVSSGRSGISYHGIGREFPNQMEVMVDGRSVYESIFSTVNWGTLGIDLADIDYIEIVRGSNAAAQGSNAFMGSVNIVTRKPIQDSGLLLHSALGDVGTRNGGISYSDSIGALDYRASLGYRHSDGFPGRAGQDYLEDGLEHFHGNFRGAYTPTLQDDLELHLGYAEDRMPWEDGVSETGYSPSQFASHFQSAIWTRSLDSDNDLQLHLYHNYFRARNYASLGPLYSLLGLDEGTANFLTAVRPPPQPVIDLVSNMTGLDSLYSRALIEALNLEVSSGFGSMRSERYDAQLQHDFRLSPVLRGAWGAGLRREFFESAHPYGFNAKVDETYLRLFLNSEWQATQWLTFNGGMMVEDTFVGTLASPRVSANLSLHPGHSLRLGVARGNRAPSLLEANEDSISVVNGIIFDILRRSDPGLREEKLESFEVAYLFRSAGGNVNVDLRLFDEKITDVIDDPREPNVLPTSLFDDYMRRFINTGYWHITGGEIQLGTWLTDSTFLRLHYANTDLDSRMLHYHLPVPIPTDRDDRMARHSGGVLVSQQLTDAWSLSLTAYHQSGLRWEDGDQIDGFTRVDAQLAYGFQLGRSSGSLRLVAQNLGGDYSEFDQKNVFETRYFLTINLELPE